MQVFLLPHFGDIKFVRSEFRIISDGNDEQFGMLSVYLKRVITNDCFTRSRWQTRTMTVYCSTESDWRCFKGGAISSSLEAPF